MTKENSKTSFAFLFCSNVEYAATSEREPATRLSSLHWRNNLFEKMPGMDQIFFVVDDL